MEVTHLDAWPAQRGIVVIPDILSIVISAVIEDAGAANGVGLLQAAASQLEKALHEIAPGARLEPGVLGVGTGSTEKSARATSSDVRLGGRVVIPLLPSIDFWARAKITAHTVETLGNVSRTLAKTRPVVKLHWSSPVPTIASVEPFRAALAARWNAHVRATHADLGAESPAMRPLSDEIIVVPFSLVETRLHLDVANPR